MTYKVKLSKRTWQLLIVILLFAFLFRSIPAWTNAAWGNDIGVYYGLTNSFVKYGTIFNSYEGWGGSYEYFPLLYIIGGSIHLITGVSIIKSLTYSAPVFGALTSLFLFLITYELFNNKRIALLAAAFLAVNPIHLYQTSHAAPLTIGHFFMLLSLYFFLALKRRKRFLVPLIISSGLLILSHHLTTYIYIIALTGIISASNLFASDRKKKLLFELTYLAIFSAASFTYWLLVAGNHFNSVMKSGSQLLPKFVIVLFYFGLIGLFLFTSILKKYFSKLKIPKYHGKYDSNIGLSVVAAILLIMIMGTTFITIPGTSARLNWEIILVSIPIICIIAFMVMGSVYLYCSKRQAFLFGWMGAILFSLIVALITQNRILFPERHFEYLMVPLSVIAAIGAYEFYRRGLKFRMIKGSSRDMKEYPLKQTRLIIKRPTAFRRFCIGLVLVVLISNGISSYPMRTSVGGFNEDYSQQVMYAMDWFNENVDKNLTIATQLPYAQFLESEGYNFRNVTYENDVYWLWYVDTWEECVKELNTSNSTRLPPVSYILVDNVMFSTGVQLLVGGVPLPMTPGSYAKFSSYPFIQVYRNETQDHKKWAEVYQVEWDPVKYN